jgi:hypothetical protein
VESDRREIQQVVRLLRSAYEQSTSLTIGELAVLMNCSTGIIGRYIKNYYTEHPEETCPLRGYINDQGSNSTHKALICALHERGENETDIARKTHHRLSSVGRYINRYTRVKQLLERGLPTREIVGIAEHVVGEYCRIAVHFHSNLGTEVTLKNTKQRKKTHRRQMAL